MDWWRKIDVEFLGSVPIGLNSLIILGAWTLWNHCNRCIFDGIAPSLVAALSQVEEEKKLRSWLESRGFPSCWHNSPVGRTSLGRLRFVFSMAVDVA
jgi:hypothetical protein